MNERKYKKKETDVGLYVCKQFKIFACGNLAKLKILFVV